MLCWLHAHNYLSIFGFFAVAWEVFSVFVCVSLYPIEQELSLFCQNSPSLHILSSKASFLRLTSKCFGKRNRLRLTRPSANIRDCVGRLLFFWYVHCRQIDIDVVFRYVYAIATSGYLFSVTSFVFNKGSLLTRSMKLIHSALISQSQASTRRETDHSSGSGPIAVTGQYDSKNDSFNVTGVYMVDPNVTAYGTYGVTDEQISLVGVESGFTILNRNGTADAMYIPPADLAMAKIAIRQGKYRLSTTVNFSNFSSKALAKPSARYELDAQLSGLESLKMMFDGTSKAARLKVTRKLDAKNKLDGEYIYNNRNSKAVNLTMTHNYSKLHTFLANINYGPNKFTVQWEYKTENGPWTVSSTFPFDSRYVIALVCLPAFVLWLLDSCFGPYYSTSANLLLS